MLSRGIIGAGLALVAGLALGFAAAPANAEGFVLFGCKDEGRLKLDTPESRPVAPISSPYDNEDATITTDVRAWYAYHSFPHDIVLNGGHAQTAAVQARLAITDRLQLVAYKDGYLWIDTPAVDQDGRVDVAAGLKYAIIQDFESQFHWAAGLGYELPVGDPSVFQNDAEFRIWTSIDKGFDKLHFTGNINYFLQTTGRDKDAGNSDRLTWHLHADYYVCKWFSPVLELNGFHITKAGIGSLDFQGADILNLGTGAGDPVVTLAPGFEVRPIEHLGLRGAYEFPLTNYTDIYGYRLTFSAVYTF